MRLILAICALLVAGCSDRQTELFNGPPIESPIPKWMALRAAYAAKVEIERHGYQCSVWPGSQGKSMGQAVSDYAVLVSVDDFDNTRVNDAVFWDYLHEHQRITILHQVVVRHGDAMRTAGLNNALPDWAPVLRENYRGTMVVEVNYRRDSR